MFHSQSIASPSGCRLIVPTPPSSQVDDGLPLRKASFACVDTMLDSLPGVLEMSALMPYLAKGLADKVTPHFARLSASR